VTTQVDPAATTAPNLLNQHLQVAAPNRVWTADITAVPTGEGWLYVAVLLDLFARRIMGWAARATLNTELVCAAWQRAVARRARGLMHLSDRDGQCTSARYQLLMRMHGVPCSMSRPGNCFDNAPTESSFRTLKTENAAGPWPIDDFHNRKRLHSSLNYLSPAAFEAGHAVGRRSPRTVGIMTAAEQGLKPAQKARVGARGYET
jgi:putative transposase